MIVVQNSLQGGTVDSISSFPTTVYAFFKFLTKGNDLNPNEKFNKNFSEGQIYSLGQIKFIMQRASEFAFSEKTAKIFSLALPIQTFDHIIKEHGPTKYPKTVRSYFVIRNSKEVQVGLIYQVRCFSEALKLLGILDLKYLRLSPGSVAKFSLSSIPNLSEKIPIVMLSTLRLKEWKSDILNLFILKMLVIQVKLDTASLVWE